MPGLKGPEKEFQRPIGYLILRVFGANFDEPWQINFVSQLHQRDPVVLVQLELEMLVKITQEIADQLGTFFLHLNDPNDALTWWKACAVAVAVASLGGLLVLDFLIATMALAPIAREGISEKWATVAEGAGRERISSQESESQ